MPHTWIPKTDNGLHVFKGHERYHALYIAPCTDQRDGGMVYQAEGRTGPEAAARAMEMATARCECPACCMDEYDEDTGEHLKGLQLVGTAG